MATSRRHFGSVRKLPSARYQASYWHEGERHVASDTFATKADALAFLARTETEIRGGAWIDPSAGHETLESYGRRFLDGGIGRTGKPWSPTTKELYEILWRLRLEPGLGAVELASLTPERVRSWYAASTASEPGSTQPGKAYKLLRAILNQAVEDGLLRANPARVRGAGKDTAVERPVAMPEEVAAIAAAMDEPYRPMVLLAAYCSLRFGELAGLRRRHVDLLHRTVRIAEQAVELSDGTVIFKEPKSESRRTVAVPAELIAVLEDHLARSVGPEPDALLFTSPEGYALRRTKFRARWTKATAAAGMSGLHLHDLRGSGATWAATAGATIRELMARLGHKTERMAIRYQHATAERDRAIADRLDSLFRAAKAGADPTEVASITGAGRDGTSAPVIAR
ncbi:MAG TPA: site-specific integrase [Acidimicrobiales bacterium]|nr:site-specific integrase [Acidimicrobiales bacterium]